MAQIGLRWKPIKIPAITGGWVKFKKELGDKTLLKEICDARTVYVVRVCRPFCFHYPDNVSGVAYIGRGDFQKRMTAHLRTWIKSLACHITDVEIEILVCLPRVQKHANAYKDVEASLIDEFEVKFGSLPVRNGKREKKHLAHTFSKTDIARAFGRGKDLAIIGPSGQ